MTQIKAGLLTTTLPNEWPPSPTLLSYSALKLIEECPRRWALQRASYSDLWEGRGYPGPLNLAATEGDIVHRSLARIVQSICEAGCVSVQDIATIAVLRALGGFSCVVDIYTNEVLSEHEGNPRIARFLPAFARIVKDRRSELRERVQVLLAQVELTANSCLPHRSFSEAMVGIQDRTPLPLGSHPEVRLEALALGWMGVADLINLTSDSCEIVDFKTGQPQAAHADQLRVYSLLWTLDERRNPDRRDVTKLTLYYLGQKVDVPTLTSQELDDLEQMLVDRTKVVNSLLAHHPPEARPTPDFCSNCPVRHLCSEYWTDLLSNSLASKLLHDGTYADIELMVLGRQNASGYYTRVTSASTLPNGSKALFLTGDMLTSLNANNKVRVLGARIEKDVVEGDDSWVATLTRGSEMFITA